ncbi:MAG TPA: DNA-binding protein WhiA [Candidatus Limnocylindrales bacterium]
MSAAEASDLVAALRAELAAIEPARRCDRLAERTGLGPAAQGRAKSPLLGRLAVRLDDSAAAEHFDWDKAADHCRVAFLRGAFLARGSLSVTGSGTHLELVVDAAELGAMTNRMAALGLPAGARIRRGRGVLTWKGADAVTEFLRRIGASAATLELESRLVHRALTGHLNRVVNAENANLRRAVVAARRQLAEIDALEQRGKLRRLPKDARRVAVERRRAPEATFSELAAKLDMSRSQVQRAFEMIGSAALHVTDETESAPRYT